MVRIVADTDAISQAASRMQQQAQGLESALGLLSSAAGRLNYWEGASYYQFTDLWQQASSQLRTLAQEGQRLGSRLQAAALAFAQTDEQQAALAATSASVGGDNGDVLGASTSRSGDDPLGAIGLTAFTLWLKELVQTDQQINEHPNREALFALLGPLADKIGVDTNYLWDAIRTGKIDPQVMADTLRSEIIDAASYSAISDYGEFAIAVKLAFGETPLMMANPLGDNGDEQMQQNNAHIDAIRQKLGLVQENGKWVLPGYPQP